MCVKDGTVSETQVGAFQGCPKNTGHTTHSDLLLSVLHTLSPSLLCGKSLSLPLINFSDHTGPLVSSPLLCFDQKEPSFTRCSHHLPSRLNLYNHSGICVPRHRQLIVVCGKCCVVVFSTSLFSHPLLLHDTSLSFTDLLFTRSHSVTMHTCVCMTVSTHTLCVCAIHLRHTLFFHTLTHTPSHTDIIHTHVHASHIGYRC